MSNIHQTAEFKLEKRSVNSKVLCQEIQKNVEELITSAGVVWGSDAHRDGFIETCNDGLLVLEEEGKLEQGNAMCDFRNNTIENMDKGIYIVEISFKQKNCLNTTRLIYTIKDLLVSSLKDLIDFHVSP